MNYRRTLGCMALCTFYAIHAKAQYSSNFSQTTNPKTIEFGQFPQKSQCNTAALAKLFSLKGPVSVAIAKGLFLRGELIENIQQNPAVQSININLTDFPGAIFTLSRIHLEDGSILYSGHIVRLGSIDAMILSAENGKYYLSKTLERILITD
jgi:hypothetical protein